MNRIYLMILFVLAIKFGYSQQTVLLEQGVIAYERRENLTFLKKKQMVQNSEGFQSIFFNLSFNTHQSRYAPAAKEQVSALPGADNIVFRDLEKGICYSQKNVLGQFFLTENPLANITWKITDEKRIIAGFECKRANAMIMDSIYAVAFYTDDIVCSSGPESFAGLPGMILGLVLPHQHLSWFALKVTPETITDSSMQAPAKGVIKTPAALKEIVRTALAADPNLNEYLYLYLL